MSTFFVDIDGQLCTVVPSLDYSKAEPIVENIEKVNRLFDDGHKIVIWTSRGVGSGEDWRSVTINQLKKWDVRYHELNFGKPIFDRFFDDKAGNLYDFEFNDSFNKEVFSVKNKIKSPYDYNIMTIFNHFRRYSSAINHLDVNKSDTVLDASCGTGYGSFILSHYAKNVVGVDVNDVFLDYASSLFNKSNLSFKTYDYCVMNDFVFDKICCIETLEHVEKKQRATFVSNLLSLLRVGGCLFVTTPIGSDKPSSYNKFHLCEPSLQSVYDLFIPFFRKSKLKVDSFVNSFGHNSSYLLLSLYDKKGGV